MTETARSHCTTFVAQAVALSHKAFGPRKIRYWQLAAYLKDRYVEFFVAAWVDPVLPEVAGFEFSGVVLVSRSHAPLTCHRNQAPDAGKSRARSMHILNPVSASSANASSDIPEHFREFFFPKGSIYPQ